VEKVLQNGTNEFGDVAILMQVAAPAAALNAWFIRRDKARLKRDSMALSRTIQTNIRHLVPFYYLQEDSRLTQNFGTAALLVWAAMPVSTGINFDRNSRVIQFNRDDQTFWNWADIELRRAVASDAHTTALLVQTLLALQKRLQESGNSNQQFFAANTASSWQQTSLTADGDRLLQGLLFAEAQIIDGAAKALGDVNDMLNDFATAPARAVRRFADFGANLTEAFHDGPGGVYGDASLRALSSMILVEVSRAIAPELTVGNPTAMLNILTLKNQHSFDLGSFPDGGMPPRDQVALAQTLVSL